ncbi:MAG: AmmeMemoRadiSam system protein A [Lachnospiraceae bacterium]|jgi:AmmeMemoRadiSam system protein A|nr:AmmeMemoRadiSam system protein A [Lachnospiraceae bacterium]
MGIAAAFMVPHPPLIVPDVGKGEEKKIMDTIHAYHEIGKRIGELKPDTIVVVSPHQTMYADYFHISPGKGAKGDLGQFRAGNVKMEVSYDTEFVKELCRLADIGRIPAGTLGEREKRLDHGTMVPLYFVGQYWKGYHLVRIGLSGLPLITHYELGQCIQKASESLGRKTVLIGSGDLSHRLKEDGPYGYREEGPAYDSCIMDIMARGGFGELLEFSEDFCEKAGECGHRSFTIMAGALDRLELEAERLSYEGPFGVGYGICSYIPCGWNPERDFGEKYEQKEKERLLELRGKEDEYVRLARKTIEEYVRNKKKINLPEGLPEEMSGRAAGVFVSLKKDGRLRGCIGTICAVQKSVAEEIIENAISASVRDSRFEPVEPEELDKLVISVDVLGDTEKIESPAQLDVKRYGVIVTKGYKRGLLLPNLDGVDTVEEQIAIAKRKAGIGEPEQVELERFEVVRHF